MGIRRMPTISKSELLPGDILMLYDNEWSLGTHAFIKMGQGLFGRGDSTRKLVHAALWMKPGEGAYNREQHEISEASGAAGKIRSQYLRKGLYVAFQWQRASPLMVELSRTASAFAAMWVNASNHIPIEYGRWSAVQSVAHYANYGERAAFRAKHYHEATMNPRNGPVFPSGAFCSEFVIAAYQAASIELGIPISGVAATDAKHSSVTELYGLLTHDGRFMHRGNVAVDASPGDGW